MLQTVSLPGNWTLEFDEDTKHFEMYFTHPKTGLKALYYFAWGERRHDSLPEFQPLIHEVVGEDGTIGLIHPLVTKYKGVWRIAVGRVERHVGRMVEVVRKSWDNPSVLPVLNSGAQIQEHDLSYGDSNTARVVGGDLGIVVKISILTKVVELPKLPGKLFWMKEETFADHRDLMGCAAIGKAYMKGIISK